MQYTEQETKCVYHSDDYAPEQGSNDALLVLLRTETIRNEKGEDVPITYPLKLVCDLDEEDERRDLCGETKNEWHSYISFEYKHLRCIKCRKPDTKAFRIKSAPKGLEGGKNGRMCLTPSTNATVAINTPEGSKIMMDRAVEYEAKYDPGSGKKTEMISSVSRAGGKDQRMRECELPRGMRQPKFDRPEDMFASFLRALKQADKPMTAKGVCTHPHVCTHMQTAGTHSCTCVHSHCTHPHIHEPCTHTQIACMHKPHACTNRTCGPSFPCSTWYVG